MTTAFANEIVFESVDKIEKSLVTSLSSTTSLSAHRRQTAKKSKGYKLAARCQPTAGTSLTERTKEKDWGQRQRLKVKLTKLTEHTEKKYKSWRNTSQGIFLYIRDSH